MQIDTMGSLKKQQSKHEIHQQIHLPHMRCAEVKENQFSACSVSVTSSSLS